MTLKPTVKALAQLFGFDIVRHAPAFDQPFPVLPYLVRERLSRNEPFYFVQVGANDGIADDPISELVATYRLPGLLIEPLPDVFRHLKETYAGHSQLVFENVAISDREQKLPLYRANRDPDVSSGDDVLASFFREHLLREGIKDHDIVAVEVQAVRFESLMVKYSIDQIALLQVDTEGYDYDIVKLAFAAGLRPEMINFEHCHLPPMLRYECKRVLANHGYRFIEVGKDTLALKNA